MKGGDETDPLVLRSGPPPLAAKQTCTDRGGSLSPATTNLVLASDGVLHYYYYRYYYYYYHYYFVTIITTTTITTTFPPTFTCLDTTRE